jgi:hypothetical protein
MGRTGESYAAARARLERVRARRALDSLSDADLVARCAGPVTRRLHVADPAARVAALRQLTAGQRAVLAFSLVHDHGDRGLAGLCAELPHRLVHDGFWTLLESGLRVVEDEALLALLRRLRREVASTLAGAGVPDDLGRGGELEHDGFVRLVEELERLDPEVMTRLDEEYRRILPGSLRRVALHIRTHAREFVAVEA